MERSNVRTEERERLEHWIFCSKSLNTGRVTGGYSFQWGRYSTQPAREKSSAGGVTGELARRIARTSRTRASSEGFW